MLKKFGFLVFFASALIAAMALPSNAVPIIVAGPSPAAPFVGTLIDFEGFAEGTLIDTEYAASGVTFTQDDGGTPMIDNVPVLFGYGVNSGTGVLTGSTTGGAPFPTVAGLVAVFTSPVSQAAAFFSDSGPLGSYTITAFDGMGMVIESFIIALGDPALPTVANGGCASGFNEVGCGAYFGIDAGSNIIASIQFGPSSAFGDAFAIDDLIFAAAAPEPATLLLLGSGLAAVGLFGRKKVRN